MLDSRLALLGNGLTHAWLDESGGLSGLGFPAALFAPSAPFSIRPSGAFRAERLRVGATAVFQTTFETPSGKAIVLDFLPVRRRADSQAPVVLENRLVRVVEIIDGQVDFEWRAEPVASGPLVIHPNGYRWPLVVGAALLQTEAESETDHRALWGRFSLKTGEKRHFILTHTEQDDEIPEVQSSVADWELDGTLDAWIAWGTRFWFNGAQRSHLLPLAVTLQAAWNSVSGTVPLACIALAVWGFEDALAAFGNWQPDLNDPLARSRAADALDALEVSQRLGLISGVEILPVWPGLQAIAVAFKDLPVDGARTRALKAATALADDLMLEIAGETVGDAVVFRAPENAAASACGRIRQELETGAYLQARRQMDALLHDFEPDDDLSAIAQVLWTASLVYLQEPPRPERVHIPDDLPD